MSNTNLVRELIVLTKDTGTGSPSKTLLRLWSRADKSPVVRQLCKNALHSFDWHDIEKAFSTNYFVLGPALIHL